MICSVPKCEKNAIARGWCARHYDSWRYHGDPNSAKRGPRGEAVAWAIRSLEKEITGLKLRVADLDRDLTALEGTLTGDGR